MILPHERSDMGEGDRTQRGGRGVSGRGANRRTLHRCAVALPRVAGENLA